jgi:PAS domain S-box-containing protein
MASGKRKTRASAARPRRAPPRAAAAPDASAPAACTASPPVSPGDGLGTSAGGLEALTDFSTAMRPPMPIDVFQREAALRTSDERFRLLVENVKDYAIFSLDAHGNIASWNQGAERIKGYREAEIVGQPYARLFTAEDVAADRPRQLLASAASTGRYEEEGWRLRKDGTRFWAHIVLTPIRADDGVLRGYVKITRDLTDRKEMERELLETATREQQRIGQDLHDSVGQDLTALGFLAESLAETLAGQGHADAGLAAKITSGLRQVFSRVRSLTQGLMPVEVDAAGLMTALAELAKRLGEQSGVPCTFTCAEPAYVQNNQIATHLYRIAQEAVTNALKHAKPRHIRISLDSSDGGIALRVADDGAGMPSQAPEAGSMGLRIMRHRAGLINAVLTIDSAPGQGTVVTCTLIKDSRHDQKNAEGSPAMRPGPDR